MSTSSSSSRRSRILLSSGTDEVWPEPFIEALATQVAVDASTTHGRLSAAQPLSNLFQVCSTWRAISRSDLLWQSLARRVWRVATLGRDTWRDEYIHRHRTASNFRSGRYAHAAVEVGGGGPTCRRLAVGDRHVAAGFSNGAVQLYRLSTGAHRSTFYPQHRDRLGEFSTAISGIILSNLRLVFATLDGDIHVAVDHEVGPLRRVHLGDVVRDGALVDFSGCDRWWVGLCAGVPGHAFRVWNSITEELVFVGGTLTDPEAVMGWHTLTESSNLIGRIRVTGPDTAVACTSLRVVAFDLRSRGLVLGEEEFRREIVVDSFDSVNDSAMLTDGRGSTRVLRAASLEEVCRFVVRGGGRGAGGMMGCMNGGYGLICVGGVIRVWEIESGEYLYRFGGEEIGEISALISNERHVVAYSSNEGTIHVWDFGG